MALSQFLPSGTIAMYYVIFAVFRFENQRWIRAIASGKIGSNPMVPLFVNLSGFLGLIVMVGVVIGLFWYGGWQVGIGTLALGIVSGIATSILLGLIVGGDNFLIWLIATLGMWPVGFLLVAETTIHYVP